MKKPEWFERDFQFGIRPEMLPFLIERLLLSPVRLNIVCFTINRPNLTLALIQTFLNAVRDNGIAYFTPTIYKGTPAIRAAISNWQTGARDIEIALEAIANVWDELNRNSESTAADIKTF